MFHETIQPDARSNTLVWRRRYHNRLGGVAGFAGAEFAGSGLEFTRSAGVASRPAHVSIQDLTLLEMAEPNEQELIDRCRAGDEDAFRQVVERYKKLVFALIVRTVSDRSRAEDLAQEVFLRVHRGLPYFRGEARLSTWIYRIVANLCTEARAGRGGREVSLDDRSPPESQPRPALSVTDRAYSDLELRDRLEKALARLPPAQRLLIAGHYLKGVQYEELAEALGIPLGTVKSHLYRAKRTLRELLEREL